MARWPLFAAQEKQEKEKRGRPAQYTWTFTTTGKCGHGLKASAHSTNSAAAREAAYQKLKNAIDTEATTCKAWPH